MAADEKLRQALEYRRQGYTYAQIGAEIGVGHAQAIKLVERALKNWARKPANEELALELARLDELMTGVYAAAVQGDTKALDAVLKIMDRRARLLGFDGAESTPKGKKEQTVQRARKAATGKYESIPPPKLVVSNG